MFSVLHAARRELLVPATASPKSAISRPAKLVPVWNRCSCDPWLMPTLRLEGGLTSSG
jgi:hypothetical protein